jgi:hypothetical protein
MSPQAKSPSKQQQLREILKGIHGSDLQSPNAKQIANYQAHVATQDAEYFDFVELLGMYAGYYVISTRREINYCGTVTVETSICATRLHLKFYTLERWRQIEGKWDFEKDGTTYQKGSHSRFLFAQTVEGIINEIVAQMAHNAGYRNMNVGLWQRRLPVHLQRQPNPQPSWQQE